MKSLFGSRSSITRADVINCYKYILGREPENDSVVEFHLNAANTREELINTFKYSEEFKSKYANTYDTVIKYGIVDHFVTGGVGKVKEKMLQFCVRTDVKTDSVSCAIASEDEDYFGEIYGISGIIEGLCENGSKGSFIDIGANIGAWSVCFANLGYSTYSIEASEDNIKILENSAKLNGLPIRICSVILHEHTGKMYFYQNGPYGMCSSEEDAVHTRLFSGIKPYELTSVCLDDWMDTAMKDLDTVDFIKMDIEGSEVAALRGGHKFLNHFRYPTIFCESNKWTLYIQGETSHSLIAELKQLGYSAHVIENGILYRIDDGWFQENCNTDYLFIHNSHTEYKYTFKSMKPQTEKQKKSSILSILKNGLSTEIAGTLYDLKRNPNASELMKDNDIRNEIMHMRERYRDDSIVFDALASD